MIARAYAQTSVCWPQQQQPRTPVCFAPKAAICTRAHYGVVRHKPIGSASLGERNEFGLVAGYLREAALLPVLLGLLDPVR
jgi:hypothetical protein